MMFIPGCGCCGASTPCGCGSPCAVESLPETVTVTLSDVRGRTGTFFGGVVNATFGSGAALGFETFGGFYGGPITKAFVLSGGSGYARLGRVAPTLSASATPGSGAEFMVSTSKADSGADTHWTVSSISVSGGAGYKNNSAVTVTAADGDTTVASAKATLKTNLVVMYEEPTVAASVGRGSGAVLAVTLASDGDSDPEHYHVESVAVTSGGSGYTDGAAVTFTCTAGTTVTNAAGTALSGLAPPTSLTTYFGSGTGAIFDCTFTKSTASDGRDMWSVDSVTIDDGGSGYVADELISLDDELGASFDERVEADLLITSVDENGAITGVTLESGGGFRRHTGVIESIEVTEQGKYFKSVTVDSGVPVSVTVTNSGHYYREDKTATPYVADATVTIGAQVLPSNGSGAEFEVTIDDDPGSESFGRITSVSVIDGGDGYVAWYSDTSPLEWFDGKTLVLRKEGAAGCKYSQECEAGTGYELFTASISLEVAGSGCKPQIVITTNSPGLPFFTLDGKTYSSGCEASATLTSDIKVADCETLLGQGDAALAFAPTDGNIAPSATATIEAGGSYSPSLKCLRVTQADLNALSVSVTFEGETFDFVPVNESTPDCVGSVGYLSDAAECDYADDLMLPEGVDPTDYPRKVLVAEKRVICDPSQQAGPVASGFSWVCEYWNVVASIKSNGVSEKVGCRPYWLIEVLAQKKTYSGLRTNDGTFDLDTINALVLDDSVSDSIFKQFFILEDGDLPIGTFNSPFGSASITISGAP